MEDTLPRVRPEHVGQFTIAIRSGEPSPEVEERWARRAQVLAEWLVGEWHREQGQAEEMVIRRHDLN